MGAIERRLVNVTAGISDSSKRRQQGRQEPSKPDALTMTLCSDLVHPIVPVTRADQRQPMGADLEGSGDRARAVLVERDLCRQSDGPFVHAVFIGARRALLQQR